MRPNSIFFLISLKSDAESSAKGGMWLGARGRNEKTPSANRGRTSTKAAQWNHQARAIESLK